MPSRAETEWLEREYVAHRPMALALLGRQFAGLWREHADIYNEAWADALELLAHGEEIKNLGGLLRVLVTRTAIDRLRKHTSDLLAPDDERFARAVPEHEMSHVEEVELRLEVARVRHVLDSIDEHQAAVIRWRLDEDVSSSEIARRLGISKGRAEHLVTEAHRNVEKLLVAPPGEESVWSRRQRSILLACLTGVASARQRSLAQQMVDEDPACRVMLAELRSSLEQIAALLPLPVVVAVGQNRLHRVRLDAFDRLTAVRDAIASAFSRLAGNGPTVEQASGGLAGIGSGVAAKVLVVCLAVGGGTVACLDTGLLSASHASRDRSPRHHRHEPRSAEPPVRPPARPVVLPAATAPTWHHPAESRAERHVPKTVSAPAAPSPAPPGSTEFGPGSIGSTPRDTQPAPAPASGGGEFLP